MTKQYFGEFLDNDNGRVVSGLLARPGAIEATNRQGKCQAHNHVVHARQVRSRTDPCQRLIFWEEITRETRCEQALDLRLVGKRYAFDAML